MAKFSGCVAVAVLGVASALITGCRVDEHKGEDGKNEDVKIATPFGGMSVKTDQYAVEGGVGLSVYPGAVLSKKESGKDNGAADIDINVAGIHVGVKALEYRTKDSPEKVLAFYRKDMAHYGAVILCRGNQAVGTPDHTQDGLSCDKEKGGHVHVGDEDYTEELKAGSKQHQHIVAVSADGSGAKIGLVALDLPGHLSKGNDKDVD